MASCYSACLSLRATTSPQTIRVHRPLGEERSGRWVRLEAEEVVEEKKEGGGEDGGGSGGLCSHGRAHSYFALPWDCVV